MQGAGEKRVTLQDIARRTGFTVNTVSRALKNKPDISASTCKKIQQVAREMGYVPNYAASSLRSGRTKTIGLILGAMSNPYYAIVADMVHDAASALGYTVLTLCTRENAEQEMQAVEAALSRQVDGIMLFPSRDAAACLKWMKASNIPYVLMSRHLEGETEDCVLCDEDEGGYLAARHLIDAGRRNLAFLCCYDIVYSTEHRMQGFLRACEEAGIPPENRHTAVINSYDAAEQLLQWRKAGVDGVFVFCDMEAWNTISALETLGVSIPGDMSVVGFDNIQGRINFPMPLCTVDPSMEEMINAGLTLLRQRIHREELPPQIIKVPARIVCRKSCGCQNCR